MMQSKEALGVETSREKASLDALEVQAKQVQLLRGELNQKALQLVEALKGLGSSLRGVGSEYKAPYKAFFATNTRLCASLLSAIQRTSAGDRILQDRVALIAAMKQSDEEKQVREALKKDISSTLRQGSDFEELFGSDFDVEVSGG